MFLKKSENIRLKVKVIMIVDFETVEKTITKRFELF